MSTSSSSSLFDYAADFSEIFHTELFSLSESYPSSSSPTASSSRASTPLVLTPPPSEHMSFPDIADDDFVFPAAPLDTTSFCIDPQLVTSPTDTAALFPTISPFAVATPPAASPLALFNPNPSPTPAPVSASKPPAGKPRKGTVHSGRIAKKPLPAPPPVVKQPSLAPGTDDEDGESPQTLTSIEKRRLRNKLSARTFRARRQEHISTLESTIAERDRLVSALNAERDAVKAERDAAQAENRALRAQIAALVCASAASTAPSASSYASTSSSPLSSASTSSSSAASTSKNPWGAAAPLSVHTMRVPADLAMMPRVPDTADLAGKRAQQWREYAQAREEKDLVLCAAVAGHMLPLLAAWHALALASAIVRAAAGGRERAPAPWEGVEAKGMGI
ncbi:hypothetical protein C8J57DRAFT_1713379 [Mycena rebaudengoi]|nr:hypothetical protein C8J57DRAFT_1713379 [Mycena rebaudengoi]